MPDDHLPTRDDEERLPNSGGSSTHGGLAGTLLRPVDGTSPAEHAPCADRATSGSEPVPCVGAIHPGTKPTVPARRLRAKTPTSGVAFRPPFTGSAITTSDLPAGITRGHHKGHPCL
eukprot:4654219-Amphidinium_carterae.1